MTDSTPWETIKTRLDIIEKNVGHQWMEDWVHIMRNNFGRVAQDIPTLAYRWLKAKDELAAAEFTGNLTFSPSSLYTIQLGHYMAILHDTPGFTNQLLRLKETDSFYNSCFCLAVAAAYRKRGWSLVFLTGQNTPELELHHMQRKISVATQTVMANSLEQLLASLPNNLANTLTKLPSGGILYLELPLPPEHISLLLPKIKVNCNNHKLSVSNHTAVILASANTMVHKPWGVKYYYLPLYNGQVCSDLVLCNNKNS